MIDQLYNQDDYHWWANLASSSAKKVVPYLLGRYSINSVADVGCAYGAWLAEFKKQGVNDILGIDGSWVNTNELLIPRERFQETDLEKNDFRVKKKYDLALSLEVAEHLSEEYSDNLIKQLTLISNRILFSAAIPGQGGQHHLNEQPPSYWKEKFERHGFEQLDILRPLFWEEERVAWWYRQNIFIFENESSLIMGEKSFHGMHLVNPKAFSEKCSELSIENSSLKNLFLETFKKILKRFYKG